MKRKPKSGLYLPRNPDGSVRLTPAEKQPEERPEVVPTRGPGRPRYDTSDLPIERRLQLAKWREGNRRQKGWRKQRVQENLARMNTLKLETGCQRCGYNEHPSALDFHHIGNDKEDSVSRMVRQARSWESIQAEIDKCVVLCANCHRIAHAEEG